MNKQKSNLIHKPQFKPPTIKSPNPGLTTKSPTTASILAPTFHWQVVVDICILTLSFAQIFVPVEISIVRSDFCMSTWLVLCKNCIRIQFWHQYQPDRPRPGDLRGWPYGPPLAINGLTATGPEIGALLPPSRPKCIIALADCQQSKWWLCQTNLRCISGIYRTQHNTTCNAINNLQRFVQQLRPLQIFGHEVMQPERNVGILQQNLQPAGQNRIVMAPTLSVFCWTGGQSGGGQINKGFFFRWVYNSFIFSYTLFMVY